MNTAIKEFRKYNFPNIVLKCSSSNCFIYYASIGSPYNSDDVILIKLELSDEFPGKYPKVFVKNQINHVNLKKSYDNYYYLNIWNCISNVTNWSNAYTLSSTLLIIQNYIFDTEFYTYDPTIDLQSINWPSDACDLYSEEPWQNVKPTKLINNKHNNIIHECNLSCDILKSIVPTNNFFKTYIEEDKIWTILVKRDFGYRPMYLNINNFKKAYIYNIINIPYELQCYYTKNDIYYPGIILGLPIVSYTRNPKTKRIDYILPDFNCLLSYEAYKYGVKKTIDNQYINDFLPIYISEQHYLRSESIINKFLYIPWHSSIPIIINTCIESLDNESAALQLESHFRQWNNDLDINISNILKVISYLYRLLIRLSNKSIDIKYTNFLKFPELRTKQHISNLNVFLILNIVSTKYTYKDIIGTIFDELLTRSILWICKKEPKIIDFFKYNTQTDITEKMILDMAFDISKITIKNIAYTHAIIYILRPTNTVDILCDIPGPGHNSQFKMAHLRIQNISNWQDSFDLCGIMNISDECIITKLKHLWNTFN